MQSAVYVQPLVGSEAPDFIGESVYDQEFQTISLSQFRVRSQLYATFQRIIECTVT